MVWLGKKADLAVDEVIKNSIRAVTWTQAAGAAAASADILLHLAKHLVAGGRPWPHGFVARIMIMTARSRCWRSS